MSAALTPRRKPRPRVLITTAVKPQKCPHCPALVLDGWVDGLHTRVDPIALNRAGQLAAILASRETYTLTRAGLVWRDTEHLRYPRGPILATHRCGLTTAAEHCEPGAPPPRPTGPSDIPPY